MNRLLPGREHLGLLVLLATVTHTAANSAAQPIPQVGPSGEIRQLFTGFAFTEGPAADSRGMLYFSDIPNSKILRVDLDGQLSTFTDDSHHANGLMFRAADELVACEMDGQLVAWNVKNKTRRPLATGYQGARLDAPNDLVIDRQGGIYFTDPHYRAPQPLPQGKQGVYYLAPGGQITRLLDDLAAPNGIILSRDEQTLHVFPSLSPIMCAYAIHAPGRLGPGRDFYQVQTKPGKPEDGCDGVTMDSQGNLYLTTGLGIQVVNPRGQRLGIIQLPERPANVTFGGPDGKTLYVTARTSLYAVPMQVEGHRFAAAKP